MLATAPAAAETWTFTPTWTTPLGAFNAYLYQSVGDLDGVGRNEILFAQRYSTSTWPAQDFHGFLVAERDAEGTWSLRDLRFHPGSITGTPLFDAGPAQRAFVGVSAPGPDGNPVSSIDVFAGLPLQRVAHWPLEGVAQPRAIADVDGDGVDELLVVDGPTYHLRLRNLETLALEHDFGPVRFEGLAQLDDDPALELIGNGTQGVVIDGATGEAEWSYTSRFYEHAIAGEFDADPDTREFAMVRYEDVTVFGANPYAPLAEFPIPCDRSGTPHAIEADGDAGTEIAFDCRSHVGIGDPQLGLLHERAVGELDDGSFLVAQLDDDPSPELLVNRFRRNLRSGVVIDATTDLEQWRLDEVREGALPVARGDFAGDGRDTIAVLTAGPVIMDPATLWMLDATTGEVLRSAPLDAALDWQQRPARVGVGQLDDDPALELVFGAGMSAGSIVAVDGATLAQEWVLGPATLTTGVSGIVVDDIDGDGADEVVATLSMSVAVFAGDGSPRWQTPWAYQPIRTAVAQMDADPALELVLWTDNGMMVLDGLTQQEEWSTLFPSIPYQHLTLSNDGDGCRMLAYRSDGRIADAACGDDPLWSLAALGGRTRWVHALPGRSDLLLAVLDERLALVTRDGERVAEAAFPAPSWGESVDSLQVFAEQDAGRTVYRIIAGGDGAAWSIRLAPGGFFVDGFEAVGTSSQSELPTR